MKTITLFLNYISNNLRLSRACKRQVHANRLRLKAEALEKKVAQDLASIGPENAERVKYIQHIKDIGATGVLDFYQKVDSDKMYEMGFEMTKDLMRVLDSIEAR